eukprot:TRINITY_DN6039_c0_g1_i5.p1 TRINITY_DN6039_c0_g1~~TRINITY_DN6039_c0_g1_i5.p1  ORF type:complete len:305 (+),score=107.59 TRINITY_DN6039_c0_g1_i5:94-1008(+)
MMCAGFFAFFYKFRENKLIKAVSPTFIMVTLFGCMLALCLPIFWNSVEDLDVNWCHVFPAIGGISFALVFGSLIAKTWRLYSIFWSNKLAASNITDKTLFSIIAAVLGVEVVLVLIWRWAQPMGDMRIHDVTDTYDVPVCVAPNSKDAVNSTTLIIFFIIQFLIMGVGTALATKVRKLPDQFNETQSIVTCVYNVLIISVMCVPLHFFLQNFPLVDFIIVNVGVFALVATSVLILFAPKVAAIVLVSDEGPANLKVFASSTAKSSGQSTGGGTYSLTASRHDSSRVELSRADSRAADSRPDSTI